MINIKKVAKYEELSKTNDFTKGIWKVYLDIPLKGNRIREIANRMEKMEKRTNFIGNKKDIKAIE